MESPHFPDGSLHPCFHEDAKGSYGRVHLPVAPQCNIRCNFCDRKYDCVNESRPGVTSSVLTPAQAAEYVDRVLRKEPRISVAGIAGPGDPFANGEVTLATLRLIRSRHPRLLLCLSSNGMGILPHVDELARLKVSHVTITVCAVDPRIGARIYAWVRDGNIIYRGLRAAQALAERQTAAIVALKAKGIVVKVNCIVIPGINAHHVDEIARTMRHLGADLMNCMALFPNVGTPFAAIPQPDAETMEATRAAAEQHLPQMRHCTRCRADAVGLLDEDSTTAFRGCLTACATRSGPSHGRPYVAVASKEGVLVNLHLGEAGHFSIWEASDEGYSLIGTRTAPPVGGGIRRWHQLAATLADCRAVLCSGVGPTPRDILEKSGIMPVEAVGLIDEALRTIFADRPTLPLKGRRAKQAGGFCRGSGGGCQ